jgi:hypothetical protein
MTEISPPANRRPAQAGARPADPARPLASPAAGRLDWVRSPAGQGLVALAIYLVVWLSTAVRLQVEHLTWAALDQKSQDPNFYVWGLRWWPYAIAHGLNPLYSSEIYAPAGHSLAWVTTAPPVALLAIPLTLLTGPVVAFNLLSAIAVPLSAWAAFVLCRRLTSRFWASLVGGAVFGFSAYEVNHASAGQLNLTFGLLMPILAYVAVIWWQGSISSRAFVIFAALIMAVQFYLFLETFADMTALLVISLGVGAALAGPAIRPQVGRLAKALSLAYVVALVLAAPYLAYVLRAKPPALKAITGLDLASLVLPRPQRTFGIAWLMHAASGPVRPSEAGYVGIPLLVLAILLAVTYWYDRFVRFITLMLVVVIVASLGPILYVDGRDVGKLPWARLWRLPILRNAYPSRLMLFAYLVLAVATAVWLGRPAKRPKARWALAVLVLAFIALDTPTISVAPRSNVPEFVSSGQYHRYIAPGEIVVVVSEVGNAGMLWQAQSGFYMRIAGGFINAGLNHKTDLPLAVQDLSAATPTYVADFVRFVKADQVGAILLDAAHQPPWARVFHQLGLVGHRVGNVIIYPTDGCQHCRDLDPHHLRTV